ncbi:MAG: response regulator [Myxococcota bacterium]|nr:response regulator [Myxococcota bacterium]
MKDPILVLAHGPWLTAWIRGLLTEEGYSSCNVLQPEELEPSLEFSAAFIDLALPDLAGWNLLEALVERAPVAVILGQEEGAAEQALEMGAKAFVTRPIAPHQIRSAVRHLERSL